MSNLNLNHALVQVSLKAQEYKKVSAAYRHIPTEHLLHTVDTVLGGSANYTAAFSAPKVHSKSTRHVLKLTLNKELVFGGNTVRPMILIINSYNGECATSIRVGFYRLVCSNGLIVGQSFFEERITHVVGRTVEEKLALLHSKVSAALSFLETALPELEIKLSAKLSYDQECRIIDRLALSERLTDKLKTVLDPKYREFTLRAADSGGTLWHLYNIINEYIRKYSRSEVAIVMKNTGLMDKCIEYSLAA